jgi:hypothetical protein
MTLFPGLRRHDHPPLATNVSKFITNPNRAPP